MIPVDESLLKDLRLSQMTAGDKQRLLADIGEVLEARIGDTLVRNLSDQELAQFEQLQSQGNAQAAEQWLLQRFPNYQQIAVQELQLLKSEIKENGRIINRTTSHEQNVIPQAQPQPAAAPQNQNPPQPPVPPRPQDSTGSGPNVPGRTINPNQ